MFRVKLLDAGIQDKSTSISIGDNLIERCPGTDDESDTHVEARDRRYSCLIFRKSLMSLIMLLAKIIQCI